MTSERWAERIALECPAVVRAEGKSGPALRGRLADVSLTGVAIVVHGQPDLRPGMRLGVTLAGSGGGSIAFRGRVARTTRAARGAMLGVEMIGISGDDHRRLARMLIRSPSA